MTLVPYKIPGYDFGRYVLRCYGSQYSINIEWRQNVKATSSLRC